MFDLMDFLIKNNITIATAESCTGGLLGKTFTDYSGISAVYHEGVITYANEAKIRLGVKEETLREYGAVSGETAREMAECVRKRANAMVGLSTTGIAGPGGGTDKKPVGLVYIGLSTEQGTKSKALRLSGDRDDVRRKTVKCILHYLWEELQNGEN